MFAREMRLHKRKLYLVSPLSAVTEECRQLGLTIWQQELQGESSKVVYDTLQATQQPDALLR
jgi:hypothetical protein